MSKNKHNDIDDLIKELENAQDSSKDIAGELSITENFLNEINNFNNKFHTALSVDSDDDDIIDYFTDAYIDIVQEFLMSKKSAKNEFNKKYKGFASIS